VPIITAERAALSTKNAAAAEITNEKHRPAAPARL
jgi:hypothetical protein